MCEKSSSQYCSRFTIELIILVVSHLLLCLCWFGLVRQRTRRIASIAVIVMPPIGPKPPSLRGASTPTTLLTHSIIVMRIVGSVVMPILIVVCLAGFFQFLFKLFSHPFFVKFVCHMHHFDDFLYVVLALRGFGVENVSDDAVDIVVE